jgi:hypothetical protein
MSGFVGTIKVLAQNGVSQVVNFLGGSANIALSVPPAEPLTNIEADNLVAQNVAIGGALANSLTPPGNFVGAAAAAGTGAAAYVTGNLVLQSHWTSLTTDYDNNAGLSAITSDAQKVVGDIVGIMGNECQVIGGLAGVVPEFEPFKVLADGWGNLFSLAGIAITTPGYFADVLGAGATALANEARSVIGDMQSYITNFGASAASQVSPDFDAVTSAILAYSTIASDMIQNLDQPSPNIDGSTLLTDDALLNNDITNVATSFTNFYDSEGFDFSNINESTTATGYTATTTDAASGVSLADSQDNSGDLDIEAYNSANASGLTQSDTIDINGGMTLGFYDPSLNDILAAQEFINPDGSQSIVANGDVIDTASGDTASMSATSGG